MFESRKNPSSTFHSPTRLWKNLPAQGCVFESRMLAKYFSTPCDPIYPRMHSLTLLVATMVSSGIVISLDRLAALLASRFGGRPMAYRVRQSGEGIFEFNVTSFGVAAEIALRGRLHSGCIRLSLCLKQHNKLGSTVFNNHHVISASKNNSRGQTTSDNSATKIVPFGKSARPNDLILLSPGENGIFGGFTTNAQQGKSLMQSEKGVSFQCPMDASLASCAVQILPPPCEHCASSFLWPATPNLSQQPVSPQFPLRAVKLASYKSALLVPAHFSL